MKIGTIGCCVLGCLLVAGCERLEQVLGLGQRAQEETKREYERHPSADDRSASVQAERDTLNALINGKMLVLSNRVAEAEAAMRTLQADRVTFSKELGATMTGSGDANGVGLEKALASPAVNDLAMKYLHMDFSVARGEYAEAIVKARRDEAEFRAEIRKLDQTFSGLLDPESQTGPASRRIKGIADLKRERDQLESKRNRLAREIVPTGNVYRHKREEHDREVRIVDNRIRDVERMIDQLKLGDERGRKEADQIAKRAREEALDERNKAVEKIKREHEKQASVLKTVQNYNEKTLRQLERAFVKEATELEENRRKSLEGCLILQGIRASVPKLSSDGLKKLHKQVADL